MRLFHSFDISASGLTAERLRMDIIANNLANANTTRTAAGGPYRREVPVFAAREPQDFISVLARAAGTGYLAGGTLPGGNLPGGFAEAEIGEGVRVVGIAQDPSPFRLRYDPGNPDANADGYVAEPNVNTVTEMVDLISASRAYEANLAALDAAKGMTQRAIDIARV